LKLRHVLAVATIAFALGLGLVPATPASAATSGDFVNQINSLRSSKGLSTLVVDSRLQSVAQAWAEKMAQAGSISHNPALGSIPGNWTKVGENVGVGGNVSSLMTAFINSPHHYENLVDGSFNSVGVGIAVGSDGRIYTTHDFASYPGVGGYSGASSTPAKPKSTPTTAKKSPTTSRPSTTQPPATTSTTAPTQAQTAPPALPVPVAPPLPDPSSRIVQSLAEVGSMTTQG